MHVVCRCFWCTGVEYTGTGSGRQLSRTDLLLRECGTSQRNALSKLILGIIEVKGDWQLKLSEEDDLISAFDDPLRTEMVTEITQQVRLRTGVCMSVVVRADCS